MTPWPGMPPAITTLAPPEDPRRCYHCGASCVVPATREVEVVDDVKRYVEPARCGRHTSCPGRRPPRSL